MCCVALYGVRCEMCAVACPVQWAVSCMLPFIFVAVAGLINRTSTVAVFVLMFFGLIIFCFCSSWSGLWVISLYFLFLTLTLHIVGWQMKYSSNNKKNRNNKSKNDKNNNNNNNNYNRLALRTARGSTPTRLRGPFFRLC